MILPPPPKAVTPIEESKYRAWAQDHYKPLGPISKHWHPIVKDECCAINMAQAKEVVEEGLPTVLLSCLPEQLFPIDLRRKKDKAPPLLGACAPTMTFRPSLRSQGHNE
jgi:hypothetical protein